MAVWLSKIGEGQPHPFDAATSSALESLFCSGSGAPVNLPVFGFAVTNDDLDVMYKNHVSLIRQKPPAELRDELVYFWDDWDWVPYDRENSTLVLDAKEAGRSETAISAAGSKYFIHGLQNCAHQTNMSSSFKRALLIPAIGKKDSFNTITIKPVAPEKSYEAILGRVPKKWQDIFMCPINLQVMQVPVIAEDGHTYEHEKIRRALSINGKSPMTGEKIGSKLIVNHAIRNAIKAFIPDKERFDYKGKRGESSSAGSSSASATDERPTDESAPKKKKKKSAAEKAAEAYAAANP